MNVHRLSVRKVGKIKLLRIVLIFHRIYADNPIFPFKNLLAESGLTIALAKVNSEGESVPNFTSLTDMTTYKKINNVRIIFFIIINYIAALAAGPSLSILSFNDS